MADTPGWKLPLILATTTALACGLLMLSHYLTADTIEQQLLEAKLASLKRLMPATMTDNDVITDAITVFEPERLGHRQATTLYLGTLKGDPSVMAIPVTARNGYSGDIELLVGVQHNGQITAVEIIAHKETPGLGDLIERNKSDWLQQFPGTAWGQPPADQWRVQKDGGQFDQITAATITPRAVVGAIKQALQYHQSMTTQAHQQPESKHE
ncbi:electron transport complex subunit RsxG [Marinicella meishanensis]|uniref:electron transport complex subunit RsxG n=1 Tax=Marinicella meishanensis TaxID=2873263 RepID=UPI001CBB72B5|nr:electron transport complex subunit RsxG [Marinicella sp. NBU2979]